MRRRPYDPEHCTACGDFLPCGESWVETTEVEAALYYANREIERIRAEGRRQVLNASLYAQEQRERAEAADAERDALAGRWAKVEALFAGGPDTPCRTTWHGDDEWVQVPMADLRAALGER